jgi:hypothetical protein
MAMFSYYKARCSRKNLSIDEFISHIRITPYQHLQNTFNIVSKVNKNPLTKSHQLVQKMFEIQFNTQHRM